MFENPMYVEQLLHNIQYELFDIDNLEPTEFVNRIMCYPLNGIEERILIIIRQAIHEFQNQRAIMKYIRIVDKLTKIPGFKSAIHSHITEIYSQTFIFLFFQKCNKDLQELKILRKYWLGLVHPYNIAQMKEIVLSKAGIDIDIGIKPDTVAKIKQHYATKLNMSPEEINLQFPSARPVVEDPRFNNRRYNLEVNNINPYAPNYPYPQPPQLMNNFPPNLNSHPGIRYPQNMNITPFLNPVHQVSNMNMPNSQNLPVNFQVSNQNEVFKGEDLKRKRLASQQTRVAVGLLDTNDPRPRKVQHKDESVVDYKSILSKLNELNQLQCKECGMLLSAKDSLENHKNKHFKDKLLKVDGISPAKGSGLCSREQWLKIDQEQLTHDKFEISQCRWPQHTAVCVFCCSLLTMQFKHDQWVFVNATIVSIEGRQCIMHKSCQVILEKSKGKRVGK